jgi:hypothetical protein
MIANFYQWEYDMYYGHFNFENGYILVVLFIATPAKTKSLFKYCKFSWNILILKEKFFNPEYNTDKKHSGNLMEHQILYHLIISQWYLSQAFWEPDVQVCTIYTFEVELYIRDL